MRADVKSELQMLRELVWFAYGLDISSNQQAGVGISRFCYFCHEPLLIESSNISFGHRRHGRVGSDITLHHVDENRENNSRANLAPCHTSCHKSYHAKKRAAYRKEVIKQHEQQEKGTKERQERSQRPDEEILTPGGLHE